jgi:hypothetical protein
VDPTVDIQLQSSGDAPRDGETVYLSNYDGQIPVGYSITFPNNVRPLPGLPEYEYSITKRETGKRLVTREDWNTDMDQALGAEIGAPSFPRGDGIDSAGTYTVRADYFWGSDPDGGPAVSGHSRLTFYVEEHPPAPDVTTKWATENPGGAWVSTGLTEDREVTWTNTTDKSIGTMEIFNLKNSGWERVGTRNSTETVQSHTKPGDEYEKDEDGETSVGHGGGGWYFDKPTTSSEDTWYEVVEDKGVKYTDGSTEKYYKKHVTEYRWEKTVVDEIVWQKTTSVEMTKYEWRPDTAQVDQDSP